MLPYVIDTAQDWEAGVTSKRKRDNDPCKVYLLYATQYSCGFLFLIQVGCQASFLRRLPGSALGVGVCQGRL